jgi:hypothetical protein
MYSAQCMACHHECLSGYLCNIYAKSQSLQQTLLFGLLTEKKTCISTTNALILIGGMVSFHERARIWFFCLQPVLEKACSGVAAELQSLRYSLEQEASKLSVLVEQELVVRNLKGARHPPVMTNCTRGGSKAMPCTSDSCSVWKSFAA